MWSPNDVIALGAGRAKPGPLTLIEPDSAVTCLKAPASRQQSVSCVLPWLRVLCRLMCDPHACATVICFGQSEVDVSAGRRDSGRPGLALVVLSVVEQRLDAVRAVLAGATVVEVAAAVGVSRSTLHCWIGRYLAGNVAGFGSVASSALVSASGRDAGGGAGGGAAAEASAVGVEADSDAAAAGAGRWGRGAVGAEDQPDFAAARLALPRPRKRPGESFVRFERPGPMQLWQVDIVGGGRFTRPSAKTLRT
jgi:transposase-like protein